MKHCLTHPDYGVSLGKCSEGFVCNWKTHESVEFQIPTIFKYERYEHLFYFLQLTVYEVYEGDHVSDQRTICCSK